MRKWIKKQFSLHTPMTIVDQKFALDRSAVLIFSDINIMYNEL